MSNDLSDVVGKAVGQLTRETAKNVSKSVRKGSGSPLSGGKGLAAGAGLALAPLAVKGAKQLVSGLGNNGGGPLETVQKKAGEKVSGAVKGTVKDAAPKVGDAVKDAAPSLGDVVKSALPGGGGGGGGRAGKQDTEGVGKGRRMPVQQSVDIALPIETVYNQWTQFEDWPKFMHRVTQVSQEDPCQVSLTVKIWGRTREFTADIETQRPNDRIKWKTSGGMNHTGVVAFRELAPNLTRVLLSFDVDPGGLVEKYARGTRYVKRAARADLHRFVAFIEMLEKETGAWRGVIEEGELVEDHDPSYDETREYGSADELVHGRGSDDEDSDDEDSDDEDSDDEDSDDDDSEDERSQGRNGGDPGSRRSSRSRGRTGSGGRSSSRSASSRSARSSSGSRSSSGASGSSGRSGSRASSKRSSSGSGSKRSSSGSGSRSGRKTSSSRS